MQPVSRSHVSTQPTTQDISNPRLRRIKRRAATTTTPNPESKVEEVSQPEAELAAKDAAEPTTENVVESKIDDTLKIPDDITMFTGTHDS